MKKILISLLLFIVFGAQYVGVSGAYFTDQGSVDENSLQAGCWEKPTPPSLVLPQNESVSKITTHSLEWAPSATFCPIATISYTYQVYTDSGLTTLYHSATTNETSAFISELPDGVYYWRVRSMDQFGNSNGYGSAFSFTVDTTPPTALLTVNGLWGKELKVATTSASGEFESGIADWKTAGDVTPLSTDTFDATNVTPTNGSGMARIGQTSGSAGKYAWDNRLMQSFPTGAKSLSLWYNFFTRDSELDDPGFFIRLNGTDIFHQSAWMTNPYDGSETPYSTGWQQFVYDLSPITDPNINLNISAGNTGSTGNQSWVYIDDVTTYFVGAPGTPGNDAHYTISGTDTGSGISSYHYKIDGGSEEIYAPGFHMPAGDHTITYYTEDNAGNTSPVYTARVVTDDISPSAPTEFTVDETGKNNASLSWKAPSDDGDGFNRVASYDLRYSTLEITASNFHLATKATPLSSPTIPGGKEIAFIEGLNPGQKYHFALIAYDEAPNASTMVTASGTTIGTTDPATSGDVVINELMWTGTSKRTDDVWLELKNTTDRDIALDGWKLQEYVDLYTDTTMYTFPTGTTIKAREFLVISNLDASDSSLKTTDLVAPPLTPLVFNPAHLRITLVDPSELTTMDIAWDGSAAPALYSQTGTYYYSMERTEVPGNGYDPFRWYPCIDEASKTEFFDETPYINFGTPGAKNRSENEPLIYEFFKQATVSATLKEPTITLTRDEKAHTVSFTITNVQAYNALSWELSYDTAADPQGAIGKAQLSGDKEYEKTDILLGTCSTGGMCTYHTDIKNLKVTVTLKDADGKETVMEKTL